MRNIEKYEKAVLDSLNYCDLDRKLENVGTGLKEDCGDRNCNACKKQLREWLLAEAEILDDAEKRYLRGVIRPFRDKVKSITKFADTRCTEEYIYMVIEGPADACLPRFDGNTMYKGMELNREYTLEELGL